MTAGKGPIDRFYTREGGHLPLSNFSPSEIRLGGIYWKTVEHYFQAMKTTDPEQRRAVWAEPTPGGAKRAGRRVTLRDDWEAVKLLVMRQALSAKFAEGTADARYLLGTGDRLLVEGNDWGDRFWGVDSGRGQNWLGVLLMARRAELRAGR